MRKFHENLKSLREAHGLTQENLGEKIGVAKSTISMYEGGNREPNFEMIEMIADYFNISMAALMGDDNALTHLPPDEAKLIADYRALNDQGRAYIRQTMCLISEGRGGAQHHDTTTEDAP